MRNCNDGCVSFQDSSLTSDTCTSRDRGGTAAGREKPIDSSLCRTLQLPVGLSSSLSAEEEHWSGGSRPPRSFKTLFPSRHPSLTSSKNVHIYLMVATGDYLFISLEKRVYKDKLQ